MVRKYLYLFKSGPKPDADGNIRLTGEDLSREFTRLTFRSLLRSVGFILLGVVLALVLIKLGVMV